MLLIAITGLPNGAYIEWTINYKITTVEYT